MATRRRIIEGTWRCSSCESSGIAGRMKVCPFCGSPREDSEADFDFGARDAETGKAAAATVVDADALSLAEAGADWYCANCDSSNAGNAEQCRGCGARAEYAALASPPPPPEPPPQAPPEPVDDDLPAPSSGGCLQRGLAFAVLGGFLVLCLGVVVWGTRTREVQGEVAAMSWERTVALERFDRETRSGWRDDIPARAVLPTAGSPRPGADAVRDCERRERKAAGCETRTEKVECGTTEKCEVKDLGNGFAEEVCTDVPKYCDEPVETCWEAEYDEWCRYDLWDWTEVRTFRAEGTDAAPAWPDAPAPRADERHRRDERYTVTITYDGARHAHEPRTEAEFRRFSVGADVRVDVNNFGGVSDVRPL